MKKLSKESIYRILDANLNRAAEGMRVCEEVVRFILNDGKLTAQFKGIRHQLVDSAGVLMRRKFMEQRNSRADVGRKILSGELKRENWQDIFFANMQRTKESIRVLEEFYKLIDKSAAVKLKNIRYRSYEIEKKVTVKFSALSDSGQECLPGKKRR
ncbi:MAG: thiamine-phosphate pyrophosphorylase [Candidatus Omnitrophota bacterium]